MQRFYSCMLNLFLTYIFVSHDRSPQSWRSSSSKEWMWTTQTTQMTKQSAEPLSAVSTQWVPERSHQQWLEACLCYSLWCHIYLSRLCINLPTRSDDVDDRGSTLVMTEKIRTRWGGLVTAEPAGGGQLSLSGLSKSSSYMHTYISALYLL